MMQPQTAQLRQYCGDQAAHYGLVDIRFALTDAPGATVETVAAEANAMLQAHASGQSCPLVFNDSHRH